jgi:uncharacterized protein (TIGR02145 family)
MKFFILISLLLIFTNCQILTSDKVTSDKSSDNFISNTEPSSSSHKTSSNSSQEPISSSTPPSEPNTQLCPYDSAKSTLTCIEKTYKTVTVGTQIWMAENLNFGTFIVEEDFSTRQKRGQKFCYENSISNCNLLGGLYQWHTALDFTYLASSPIEIKNHQGICPKDWHLPNTEDWKILANFLGGVKIAGTKMKSKSFGGNNQSGLNIIAAGYRSVFHSFNDRGSTSSFWEASEEYHDGGELQSWELSMDEDKFELYWYTAIENGLSVRCIKD